MKLFFFCPRWGQEHLDWHAFLKKVKDAGYDGVEASLPEDRESKQYIAEGIRDNGLQFIAQHYETVTPDFGQHCVEYEARLRNLAGAKPLFINTQTGKDYYSPAQNIKLITIAAALEKETGIRIIHETHRGKFSFAAHITRDFLIKLPDLRITLDVSHWCNTAESFLHDQREAIEIALSRTEHIHSRVGYTEGPQISDPRAPEWRDAVDFHLSCWDKVIERKISEGAEIMTITSEFGAPPYLPLLPYTKQPVVSQWDVNVYMMNLLKERYRKI